jgi:hypothetical protein
MTSTGFGFAMTFFWTAGLGATLLATAATPSTAVGGTLAQTCFYNFKTIRKKNQKSTIITNLPMDNIN